MSELVERLRAAAGRLKIFPLPSVVLLPGTAIPLHIFEPRYRALVQQALETDRALAMAQVLPGQESQLAGSPQLEPIVCGGIISLSERLDDGRFHIVVTGIARARVLRELPRTHPYREIEAEVLEDLSVPHELEEPLRRALVELLARVPPDVGQGLATVTSRIHGGQLADVIAAAVMPDAVRRREVLYALDVAARLRVVTDEVLLVVAGLGAGASSGGLLN